MKHKQPEIILASGSPRRKTLFETIGMPFSVIPSGIDESYDENLTPQQVVELLARKKVEAKAKDHPKAFIVGCDTMVWHNNTLIGKPIDEADALRILSTLSGTKHSIFTGLAVYSPLTKKIISEVGESEVTMKSLTEKEMKDYIATGESADKAGAYSIEGSSQQFIENVDGSLDVVLGLSVSRTKALLIESGLKIPKLHIL